MENGREGIEVLAVGFSTCQYCVFLFEFKDRFTLYSENLFVFPLLFMPKEEERKRNSRTFRTLLNTEIVQISKWKIFNCKSSVDSVRSLLWQAVCEV